MASLKFDKKNRQGGTAVRPYMFAKNKKATGVYAAA